jgi:hypothetical protein
MENPEPVVKEKETTKPLKVPLSDASNKWTRQAVSRFLYGLISVSIGGLLAALGGLSGEILFILGIAGVILGSVLLFMSILNAAQALQNQEPRKKTAKIILVIGILLLLRYGLVLLLM